eukprot:2451465-Amphidinium_carterae.1
MNTNEKEKRSKILLLVVVGKGLCLRWVTSFVAKALKVVFPLQSLRKRRSSVLVRCVSTGATRRGPAMKGSDQFRYLLSVSVDQSYRCR